MKIGIIREGKQPYDSRVPLNPDQCKQLMKSNAGLEILVQPSDHRCFSDAEYETAGIHLEENLEDCEFLFGVKEVPVSQLISNKTYLFFSHTIKKQSYNRDMLRAILNKNIRLIDYETLKNEKGQRVIAFGRWAGVVGAHNGLRAWGKRKGTFNLKAMHQCKDFAEAKSIYKTLSIDPVRVVITGDGRVGMGAAETCEAAGLKRISPEEFLKGNSTEAVYTILGVEHMYRKSDGSAFDMADYFGNPEKYYSVFELYISKTDIMVNAIYWDDRIPAFFSKEDMRLKEIQYTCHC